MALGNANAGTVEVDVKGDFKQFEGDLKRKGGAAGGKFGSSFGSSFGSKVAGLGAAYLGTNFLKGTINEASDLAESINVTGLAFGDARGKADEFAKGAADAIGMSESEARAAQAQIGNILGGYGLAAKDAEELSRNMITRAADIGSAWNAGTDEVSAAIQSALVGSTEPLRKFGVIIDQAAVKQKALEMGLMEAGGELDNQAKALAINALVMEQTDNVAGDFKNTQDGLANSSKTVGAMWKDMQANLGQALLPILEQLLGVLRALGPDGMKMVLMIGAGVFVFVKLTQAAMAFSGALKVLAANPWVLAAMAIIAVGILIWKNWDTIVAKLGEAWEWIKMAAGQLADFFVQWWPLLLGIMTGGIGLVVGLIIQNWDAIWAKTVEIWEAVTGFIADKATAIWGWIQDKIVSPVETMLGVFGQIPGAAREAWNGLKDALAGVADWIINKIGEIKRAAADALGPVGDVIGFGSKVTGGALGLLGFDDGGVIPGPRGAPRIVLAHAGETILPTHKQTMGAPVAAVTSSASPAAGVNVTGPLMVVEGNSFADANQLERHAVELARVFQREVNRKRRGAGRAEGAAI